MKVKRYLKNSMKWRGILSGCVLACLLLALTFPAHAAGNKGVRQEVHFKSGACRLFGYYFPPIKNPNGKGIVLCPGSNDKGCSNILFLEICKRFARLGYTCLLFDFRGYGRSEVPEKISSFEDLNYTRDAISAVSYLKKMAPHLKEIDIVGHSMGGGVAVSAGVRDQRISKIISISPGRRVTELFLRKNAKLGLKWIQQRIYQDTNKRVLIPLSLIKDVTLPISIDTYRKFIFLKPILFLEGTYEDPKDIAYLTQYVKDIKDMREKTHIILPTNHWIGTANGTKVVFSIAIHILVVTIDAWIRSDEPALKDILRRVKRSRMVPVQ